MQEWLSTHIKGDRGLWVTILLFTLASLPAVYSTSTNLVYVVGKGTTIGYLVKHLVFVAGGYTILYLVHKRPYAQFRVWSKLHTSSCGASLAYHTPQRNYYRRC